MNAKDDLLEVDEVVPKRKGAADAISHQLAHNRMSRMRRQSKAEVAQEVVPAHREERQIHRVRIERVWARDGREGGAQRVVARLHFRAWTARRARAASETRVISHFNAAAVRFAAGPSGGRDGHLPQPGRGGRLLQ